ncbi:carboxypeptidase-like regulatory domain-containing protein [Salisediminibacterium selenitireducens]|uniref:Carboxypeptidase regulatory-like domain-containing protein n=1 Tax=Bacillus selenitireducens (strain ATCC 700615 / DSM 15326 / MLS10) TaxID=439292 RepID=D6XX83_BACIE|nr:carboxypeptidase-like regulatory domain-containing protein [Salisediminibacterium selenitireducens]ADH97940.1 hypothetical protein Bsel_0400 [[Bacillus] selenitireducens MLS10]
MTIRLKVKHLVYSLLAFLALFAVVLLVFEPKLHEWQIDRQIASGQEDGAREQILDRIVRNQTASTGLIETYMITPLSEDASSLTISPASTSWSTSDTPVLFTLEEAAPYLKTYLEEGEDTIHLLSAADLLMRHDQTNGDPEGVLETMETASERQTAYPAHQTDLTFDAIGILIEMNEHELARSILNACEDTFDSGDAALRSAILHARMDLYEEDYEEAHALLQDAMERYEAHHDEQETAHAESQNGYEPFNLDQAVYFQEAKRLHERLEPLEEGRHNGTVEGRVTGADGEPLAHTRVFLQEDAQRDRSLNRESALATKTDGDGYYRFDGVIPDDYLPFVMLSMDEVSGSAWPVDANEVIRVEDGDTATYDITFTPLIEQHEPINHDEITDDTITFSWEDVDGAAFYSLELTVHHDGGSMTQSVETDITSNRHTIETDALYDRTFGVMSDPEDDELIQPETILAFSYPDGEFSWNVRAFDEDRSPIAQSNGYRLDEDAMGQLPFFRLDTRTLTNADRRLLDEDVPGALEAYRNAYADDPEDAHSLRMLTRLNGFSESRAEETMMYRRQLHDVAPSIANVSELLRHTMREGDLTEASRWKEAYLDLLEEDEPNELENGRFALINAFEGEFDQAQERLAQSVDADSYNRFSGARAVVALASGQGLDEALAIVRQNPERTRSNLAAENWERHLEHLEGMEEDFLQEAAQAMLTRDQDAIDVLTDEHPSLSSLTDAWQDRDW